MGEVAPPEIAVAKEPAPTARRLASIDAYRGFVMFLLMAESLHFAAVMAAKPGVGVWEFLAHHQEHVEWVGCTLHDLIQPSFSFLVGVALPFSLMSRAARGQSLARRSVHAFWRAFVLVALGIFLRSMGRKQPNYTFEDTLTQIGLGYGFLYLLANRPVRDQMIALAVILVGYWAAFVAFSPHAGFEFQAVGVPRDWPHLMTGFQAHWNKNANLAWRFDTWFLNLFPREKPFAFNAGGYATLSFIPTLATMILGLLAGGLLARRDVNAGPKVGALIAAGVVSLGIGYGLGALGVCPVVKRIWTPSWVLFSGGWCFLMLASAHAAFDLSALRVLAYPLVVIGANSIAAYLMTWLLEGPIAQNLRTHLGPNAFATFGPEYAPAVQGAAVVFVMWLMLFWMYRRRIFLKV